MRILLVEKDAGPVDVLCRGLGMDGDTVEWLTDGQHASVALETDPFDVAIVNPVLPGCNGLDVLRDWRTSGHDLPVLVWSSDDARRHCVAALDSGADDYVTQPVELDELRARLRALTRRSNGHADNWLHCGEIALDRSQKKVRVAEKDADLSPYEYRLLEMLMQRPGRPISRDRFECMLYGWAEGPESNSIQVLIHKLRAKIGPPHIETVRGFGYRLIE